MHQSFCKFAVALRAEHLHMVPLDRLGIALATRAISNYWTNFSFLPPFSYSKHKFKQRAAPPLREARHIGWLTSSLDESKKVPVEAIGICEHKAVGSSLINLELTTRYQLCGSLSSLFDGLGDIGVSRE
jgi:hypothetical protein